MKMFEKVLEKLGIFSKEFEESLDATTQEEREKFQKLWKNYTASNVVADKNNQIEFLPSEFVKEVLNRPESSEGKKFDTGKLSYTLLPFKAITEVVAILSFGEQKYGRDNWQKVPNAKQRYLDACFRHIISYLEGESSDPESGKHHLAHAVCCLLFILWFDLSEEV